MEQNMDYRRARDMLMNAVIPPETVSSVPLRQAAGRILAQDVYAAGDVPPFDRSPYDGYAFRAEDTAEASEDNPVTLRILEEIPAGSMWSHPITSGTACKILTGAPVPPGATAVTKYEDTVFTPETVTISSAFSAGENSWI